MSTSTRSKWVNILTILGLFLVTLQGFLPQFNLTPVGLTWVSAGVLLAINIETTVKQYLSNEISNNATRLSWVLLAITLLGAVNDFANVVPIPAGPAQTIRLCISILVTFLNVASKQIWPTAATKTLV